MTATDTIIYNKAISMGIPVPVAQIIVAQARHETGNYTSNAFRLNNNAFGYKYYSGSDWQTAPGITSSEGNAYAKYASVADSTGEVVSWLRRREAEHKFVIANLTTPEAYATALKNSGYYGDTISNYTNGIISALQKLDWQTVAVAGGISLSLVAIAIGIYFLYKSNSI